MKTSTLTAVTAIIQADPPRSKADREALTLALGLGQQPCTEAAPVLLTFDQAAQRIGRKRKAIHALARRGVIRKVKFPGGVRASGVLASEIDRLLKAVQS